MSGKRKTPRRRFKEFQGEETWEQRKVGEYCEMFNGDRGINYPSASDMVVDGIPFINAGDLENGRINLKTANKISREKFNQLGGAKLQFGDIVYCLRGTIGKNAFIDNFNEGTVASSLVAIRPNNIDGKYLYYFFNSGIEYRQRIVHDEGAAQPNLSAKSVAEFVMPVTTIEEEKKISSYFSKVDNLITLNQHKLEKLKALKKAYLTQMFPAKGESKPKLRFAGFNDEWKENEFSDITFLAGEKNKDNLPYESYSISNEKGFIPQNEQFENGGTMKEADKKMYYIVRPNSFAYNPARINVGSIGYSNLSKNVIVSSLYEVFQTVESVDDRFLWHWFKTDIFQRMIEKFQEGGVRLYFYYDKLCMGSIMLPSLEEQKRIGKYMDRVDKLIILHQRKLEKLQNLKKAYLNEMFI